MYNIVYRTEDGTYAEETFDDTTKEGKERKALIYTKTFHIISEGDLPDGIPSSLILKDNSKAKLTKKGV